MKIILEMPLLLVNNIDIQFAKFEKLILRNHTSTTALLISKRGELIDKTRFAIAKLEKKTKIFVIYIAALLAMTIHSCTKA